MANCYSYEIIAESENAIFKNVDLTIVLTMKDSVRFKKDPLLLNLSKKTVFQINKGFRDCEKPESIKRTVEDLTHAYYIAFEYAKKYDNVIILEDDAEVLNYKVSHYKAIDDYIGSNEFSIISMGSLGFFNKKDDLFYESAGMTHSHTQAQIISKKTRNEVQKLILSKNFIGHIDKSYFAEQNVLIYHEPLIVQIVSETENFKNWDGPLWVHRVVANIQGLRYDKMGWYKAYLLCKMWAEIEEYKLYLFLLIIVLLLLYCKK